MTSPARTAPAATVAITATDRAPIVIERTYQASPQEVWEMWTTKEGLESWWGPERFSSTVRTLELRVGGRLEIARHIIHLGLLNR